MTLREPVVPPADSAETVNDAHTLAAVPVAVLLDQSASPVARALNFLRKTLTIAEWEVRKLRHDPTDVLTRTVQPALWLLVFGVTFTRIKAIPTGYSSYMQFLAPGILAQSVLFLAIFYGVAIIWERDLGVIHKFLASPTPRTALVLGKALSAGVRGLPQAVIIYILALILGVQMNWNPLALLGVVVIVTLGAACFSTFSIIVACSLKTRERVMGIGQVMTMPLFFASNAIYPIGIMPGWLQVVARVNPLSYEVDGLRAMMVTGPGSVNSLGLDFAVMVLVTGLMVAIASRLYPNLVQ